MSQQSVCVPPAMSAAPSGASDVVAGQEVRPFLLRVSAMSSIDRAMLFAASMFFGGAIALLFA